MKELVKSISWLGQTEIWMLKSWLEENYAETHGKIIRFVFDGFHQMENDGARRLVIPSRAQRD